MLQTNSAKPENSEQEWHALSIKQPWAALLVAGVKTIEIRTWISSRRGFVLIHASKKADPRPEAWKWITTPELKQATQQLGGIIGIGSMVDCVKYTSSGAFAKDETRHRNAPDWFLDRGMYGFVFDQVRPLPFTPFPGQTFFFRAKGYKPCEEESA